MKTRPSGTVRKAFQVLDQLSGSQAELAQRGVAQLTGLDRTTVYGLLETLVQIGVVARDPQTARYRLGLRTLDYANAHLPQTVKAWRSIFRPEDGPARSAASSRASPSLSA